MRTVSLSLGMTSLAGEFTLPLIEQTAPTPNSVTSTLHTGARQEPPILLAPAKLSQGFLFAYNTVCGLYTTCTILLQKQTIQ